MAATPHIVCSWTADSARISSAITTEAVATQTRVSSLQACIQQSLRLAQGHAEVRAEGGFLERRESDFKAEFSVLEEFVVTTLVEQLALEVELRCFTTR